VRLRDQVFLCTSPVIGSRWCAQEKLAWIEHHLGRAWLRPTIITSDKTVGDKLQPCVLVDDRPGITGAADHGSSDPALAACAL
jgi:hypothetical protein